MQKRPHIIIFNPDEMRSDTLHHLGNKAAITPNLDYFAEHEAVSFSNAFCQNPVCVPSRCSFMTGIYPHTKGHRTMSYLLHPGEDSLLKELKESGYYVWMNDRNDLTAGQIEGWTESHADEIHYYQTQCLPLGPVNKEEIKIGDKNFYSHYQGQLEVDENGINYNSDDDAIDAAIERLKNPKDDRPICIFLGLMYPHVPYNVENPYFSAIDRNQLAERIKLEDCRGKAPIMTKIKEYQNMDEYTENDWNELRATYLGMCMKIDHQFGRLVKTLKELKIYDDCAIFFFSDHGDYTGDYSLVEKSQNTFEDCLTKVPFLVKPPVGYNLDPGVSNSLIELVDFYATAMDMAQVKPNHTHFGKSLAPVLANRETKLREFVTCEGGREAGEVHCDEYHAAGPNGPSKFNAYWPKMMSETIDELHDKGIMIRDHKYKYVSRSKTKDEFYDLENDPKEMINEIENPKFKNLISDYRLKMLKWLQQTADIVPFTYDARFTKEMLWAKVSGIVPKGEEENVKQVIDNGIGISQLFTYCLGLRKQEQNK